MKRGTPDHPKMKALARSLVALGVPAAYGLHCAVSTLEFMWHWAGKYVQRGDIGHYTNLEIAEAVHWPGDPDALVNVLIERRWIDRNEEFRLVIHDWPHHCEDAVHISLARQVIIFADGTMPRLTRLSNKERLKIQRLYAVRIPCAQSALKSAQPLPKPKPLPKPLPAAGETTYPEAAAAVQELDPTADMALFEQIAAAAELVLPDISDSEFAAALHATHKGRQQRNAALWLSTLPPYLAAKLTRIRGKPAAVESQPRSPTSAADLRKQAADFRAAGLKTHADQIDNEAAALEAADQRTANSKGKIHAIAKA